MSGRARTDGDKISDMADDVSQQDFVLTVMDVFPITGRGTAVVGPIESGVLLTGETVEILDGTRLVTTAEAQIEFVCSRTADPRSVALLFRDVEALCAPTRAAPDHGDPGPPGVTRAGTTLRHWTSMWPSVHCWYAWPISV
jgi:hypothetical protein